ncbi:GNAT family N-acetyltransferase [Rhodobacterales bacterium LSUCC0031]|nr:GNAT family N-acetyltransferase [Rhodobacterales bacterium LSUCC0031]
MGGLFIESNPDDFNDFGALHALISDAFAFMEGRIDPPSSILTMRPEDLRAKARDEDLFLIRHQGRPVACVFGAARGPVYGISKLAVAPAMRRIGLARALLDHAAMIAKSGGHQVLVLQTRVELVENHATFLRLGFQQTAETAHPGYRRPTSLTFQRAVEASGPFP